jgi:hypothetical protein
MSPEVLSTSCDQLIHFLHSVREVAADTAFRIRCDERKVDGARADRQGSFVTVRPGAVPRLPGGEYLVTNHFNTSDGVFLTLQSVVRHATKPPTLGRSVPRVPLGSVTVVPDFAAVAAHFGGGDLGAFLAGWCARGFDPFTGLLFADFLDEYGPDYAGVLGRFISPPGTLDGVPGRKPLNVFGPIRESLASERANWSPGPVFVPPRAVLNHTTS